jgi:F-box domain
MPVPVQQDQRREFQSQMPDELWLQILSLLPLHDCKTCRRVSTRWRSLVSPVLFRAMEWSVTPLLFYKKPSEIQSVGQLLRLVETLKIVHRPFNHAVWDAYCANTASVPVDTLQRAVVAILPLCRKLKSIDLSDIHSPGQLQALALPHVAQALQHLQHIRFRVDRPTNVSLATFANNFPSLQRMDIVISSPFSCDETAAAQEDCVFEPNERSFVTKRTRIKHMSIASRFFFTGPITSFIRCAGKSLQTLRLHKVRLSAQLFRSVFRYCPNINVIYFKGICGFSLKRSMLESFLYANKSIQYIYYTLDRTVESEIALSLQPLSGPVQIRMVAAAAAPAESPLYLHDASFTSSDSDADGDAIALDEHTFKPRMRVIHLVKGKVSYVLDLLWSSSATIHALATIEQDPRTVPYSFA